MKQFYTLLFTLLISLGLFAQTGKKQPYTLSMHHIYLQGMLQKQSAHAFKKPSKTEYVLAQSTRDNSHNVLNDSVRLYYGTIDSSSYDYNTMVYPYNYPYNFSPMFNYLGRFTTPQVLFTDYLHWTVDPNTLVYGFYQKEGRSYNASKSIIKDTMLYTDSSYIPNNTFVNHFTSKNNIDSAWCFVYTKGKADSNTKQFFSYNIGGYLTGDSTYIYMSGKWDILSKTYYSYSGAHDLIQIDNYANPSDSTHTQPLTEQYKYVNTFDGSHRMLTVLINENDGKTLAPYVADTFAYTGAYTYHTSWREYQYDVINKYWAPMTNMTKHIDTKGVPDTVNIDTYDSLSIAWVPARRYVMRYDSLNNPDSLLDFEYNFTYFPTTPNFTTVYYYKINPPLGVNSIVAADDNILIYPIPAKESVTISNIDCSTVIIAITDMQGRVCTKQTLNVTGEEIKLPVSYIAAGTYLLSIQNKAGTLLHRQLIIKE